MVPDIKKAEAAANKLFDSADFLQEPNKINFPVNGNKYSIIVDEDNIPAVSEWTTGTSGCLVFNCLNSCLGIIAIDKSKQRLKGYHFSEHYYKSGERRKDLAPVINSIIIELRKSGYHTMRSFGGSQTEWSSFEVDLSDIYPVIGDADGYNWLFFIESGKIKDHKWRKPG